MGDIGNGDICVFISFSLSLSLSLALSLYIYKVKSNADSNLFMIRNLGNPEFSVFGFPSADFPNPRPQNWGSLLGGNTENSNSRIPKPF